MDTFEKNLLALTNEKGFIRIPSIQRDYAEGRQTPRVNEIRRLFLNDLLKVVFSPNDDKLHLDFVYGYCRDDAFEPLDGQQRLTTLFLLYWYFCPEDRKNELLSGNKAILSYATRQSTIDFCNELVRYTAYDIVYNWKKAQDGKSKEEIIPLSEFFMKLGWFKWQWRYDPSILSMLVVVEEITNLVETYKDQTPNYNNLQNITFHLLNLDEFDMGDELYVKMNARGKLLSSFDIMKSVLEEEMQLQGYSGTTVEDVWRTSVDGNWINYFWQKYSESKSGEDILNVKYNDVETQVERQLEQLLQRMICLQFYTRDNVDYESWMIGKQEDFDKVLTKYSDIVWNRRTIEKKQNQNIPELLDFNQLINDMQCLFYDRNGRLHNATELLSIEWLPQKRIWDEYMGNPDYDLQVAFYAMMEYLRHNSAQQISKDSNLQINFNDWMHFIRNVVLLRNTHQQIDTAAKARKAVEAIQMILNNYWAKLNENDENIKTICSYIETIEDIPGLENATLGEERLKSVCRKSNPAWGNEIDKLEKNSYLWGQVIAPLTWSMRNGEPDIQLFKAYSEKLQKIFPVSGGGNILRAALLCICNYGLWKEDKDVLFLCECTFNRDRSFKNFLRSADSNYGDVIKKLIDIWIAQFPNCGTFDDFYYQLRDTMLPQIVEDWRRYIILDPEILTFSNNLKLWYDSNTKHMFLRQKLQSDTQHREIFMAFLEKQIDKEKHHTTIADWYPEVVNANSITITTNNVHIALADYGRYLYSDNMVSNKNMSAEDILYRLHSLYIIK